MGLSLKHIDNIFYLYYHTWLFVYKALYIIIPIQYRKKFLRYNIQSVF